MKKIKRSKSDEGRSWKNKKKCTHCGGSGYHGRDGVKKTICPKCKGTGFLSNKDAIKGYALDQKADKPMDYGGEMFKVENWLPD